VSFPKALLQIGSVICCSLPRANLRIRVLPFNPHRSFEQNATRRLDVSESRKNLSEGAPLPTT
jgi:hypothetical protein